MKHTSFFIYMLCLASLFCNVSAQVEIKDNSFYIDQQKFFVKGIGYEGILPGQSIRTYNPELLRFDMQRILSGGFNAIRTWGAFTKQELDILQEFDLKIIMGIWINPEGNFSNSQFVTSAKTIVNNVLSYSKDYDNIIAYIIMNEPSPAIVLQNYKASVNLWRELTDIIHSKHPNRPVSIANTPNGTYINSNFFDFSAFNVYIYNPVTVNYLHEYRGHVDYLKQLNSSNGPLIITEYGLPVSPSGPGQWGYGGNTLAEQQSGNLHMYKSLVDGGANGACIFNYTDGWWKAGSPYLHNDSPEEWYGLTEYADLNDTRGEERPVWKTIHDYQSAIITQPRTEEIYVDEIPIEIFFNDTIKRLEVLLDDSPVYQHTVSNKYLTDVLQIAFDKIKDVKLVFNCYDENDNLIKTEEKIILLTSNELTLPSIQVSVNDDCWQTGRVTANYNITRTENFTISSTLDYVYYPHVGFDYGSKYKANINGQSQVSKTNTIASNTNVFTVGAAFNITYNGFKKRIFNQLTLSRIDLDVPDTGETAIIPVDYPLVCVTSNSYNGILTLTRNDGLQFVRVEVIDVKGQILAVYLSNCSTCELLTSKYAKGIYLLRMYDEQGGSITSKITI